MNNKTIKKKAKHEEEEEVRAFSMELKKLNSGLQTSHGWASLLCMAITLCSRLFIFLLLKLFLSNL
jgi:hypothetical protein